jgi:hypothetical protein
MIISDTTPAMRMIISDTTPAMTCTENEILEGNLDPRRNKPV